MTTSLLLTSLSLTSSSLSLVTKFPQILAIWSNKSVSGINRSSLLIEMWNFMLTISYSAHFAYPSHLYAEYAGLILQDLIILSFLIGLSQQRTFPTNRHMLMIVAASALIHAIIAFRLVPSAVPLFIIISGLPSGIISRVVQIRQVVRNKDSGNLSATTWGLAFIMTSSRFMTNLLTVCDPILLFRVGSAMSLNLVLAIVILIYQKSKEKSN